MLQLIVVAACLAATVRCDYNPSTTYGVPQNNFGGGYSGGGYNSESGSSHHDFSLGQEGLGYGRHAQGQGGGYGEHHNAPGGHEQVSRTLVFIKNMSRGATTFRWVPLLFP